MTSCCNDPDVSLISPIPEGETGGIYNGSAWLADFTLVNSSDVTASTSEPTASASASASSSSLVSALTLGSRPTLSPSPNPAQSGGNDSNVTCADMGAAMTKVGIGAGLGAGLPLLVAFLGALFLLLREKRSNADHRRAAELAPAPEYGTAVGQMQGQKVQEMPNNWPKTGPKELPAIPSQKSPGGLFYPFRRSVAQ